MQWYSLSFIRGLIYKLPRDEGAHRRHSGGHTRGHPSVAPEWDIILWTMEKRLSPVRCAAILPLLANNPDRLPSLLRLVLLFTLTALPFSLIIDSRVLESAGTENNTVEEHSGTRRVSADHHRQDHSAGNDCQTIPDHGATTHAVSPRPSALYD